MSTADRVNSSGGEAGAPDIERTLRESEERWRQFGEHSTDTLWIMDAVTRRLEYLSPAFEQMWGEARGPVLDDTGRWADFLHPDDRSKAMENMPRLLAGEKVTAEYRIVRADGKVRWIRDVGFPILSEGGRVVRVAGIAEDMTDRLQGEATVRESEHRFRVLSEGMPQLVWRAVDYGRWSWASPQWTAFTGQSNRESQGWGWLETVHPDDREDAKRAWSRAKAAGVFEVEYRILCATDRRYRWFRTRATPVLADTGDIIEWLGTSTDIDDLRRLQDHQQVLLGELQHRVRNTLAIVQSIVRRTATTSADVESFVSHLSGRLASFARTQSAVTRDPLTGLDLRSIVEDELAAHATREGEQLRIDGPDIKLPVKTAEMLALAFHELATNAVKFGALSTTGGTIDLSWNASPAGINILWDEVSNGTKLVSPTRRGFGTDLLERTLPYELDARVIIDHHTRGVSCKIEVPNTGMR